MKVLTDYLVKKIRIVRRITAGLGADVTRLSIGSQVAGAIVLVDNKPMQSIMYEA